MKDQNLTSPFNPGDKVLGTVRRWKDRDRNVLVVDLGNGLEGLLWLSSIYMEIPRSFRTAEKFAEEDPEHFKRVCEEHNFETFKMAQRMNKRKEKIVVRISSILYISPERGWMIQLSTYDRDGNSPAVLD